MRRLFLVIFLTLFGLGIGLAIGAILMRRVDRAAAQMAPDNVADQLLRTASVVGGRLREAFDEGARAAAEKEAELREQFDVPTTASVLGLDRRRR